MREAAFLAQVARGTFELVHLTPADLTRMGELVLQYADFPLGGVDASVIAVAERFGVDRVATLDRRALQRRQARPRPRAHAAALARPPMVYTTDGSADGNNPGHQRTPTHASGVPNRR
jgi:hypothetical protein